MIGVLFLAESSTNNHMIIAINENVNKTINVDAMSMKVLEVTESLKFRAIDSYTGDMTGYAANCPKCSGKLSCLPSLDVTGGKNTYEDATYGKVNIVAASKNLACGSIVSFYNDRISNEKIVAIVLDRGVYANTLDFLAPSEAYASNYIGRRSITYDVLRVGW